MILHFALQRVETRVGRDRGLRKCDIEGRQRIRRVRKHFFRDAAHLGDLAAEIFQLLIVGPDDVIWHDVPSRDQPKRPVI